MGHDAFFSEELTIPGEPVNLVELVQLKKLAHLVVDLAASRGSLAEFENYGLVLGKRLLVFLNAAARGGFTDMGTRRMFQAAGGIDEFFTDEDLTSCALTLAAADWVNDKASTEAYLSEAVEALERTSLLR